MKSSYYLIDALIIGYFWLMNLKHLKIINVFKIEILKNE